MTVQELIVALSALPPRAIVFRPDDDTSGDGWKEVTEVDVERSDPRTDAPAMGPDRAIGPYVAVIR